MRSIKVDCFLILLLLSTAQKISAQERKYQFSSDILKRLATDTGKFKYDFAAYYLSFIGEYKISLELNDSSGDKYGVLTAVDSAEFKNYYPSDARKYIIAQAKKTRITIINEAHFNPDHRVFVQSILQDLHKIGYNYLGAETISYIDTLLNFRKYPVYYSGYYTNEPCFGNMIRTALEEHYYVFPYEADFRSDTINENNRERIQAENIKKFLDAHADGKALIFCGYDHMFENNCTGQRKMMAQHLKEITGIDPFTVDQVMLSEKSDSAFENPYFLLGKQKKYSVFVDAEGHPFYGLKKYNCYDVRVYHPGTKYIYGRPDWKFQNNYKPFFVNKYISNSYPCLILAFKAGEDTSTAVPVDVIELEDVKDKSALALKNGKYIIKVFSKKCQQRTFEIKMNFLHEGLFAIGKLFR